MVTAAATAPPDVVQMELAQMERAFVELCDAVRARVEYIARRAHGDDPAALVAEVWARCWADFPEKYREERAALAAGRPSPHKWGAWFCKAAQRLVIDEYRQRRGHERSFGVRHMRTPFASERVIDRLTRGRGAAWEVPVECDDEIDPNAPTPEDAFERAQIRALLRPALESLSHDERVALWAWAKDVPRRITARRLRRSRFALMRLQRRALEGLRDVYRQHGYEWPAARRTVRLRSSSERGEGGWE